MAGCAGALVIEILAGRDKRFSWSGFGSFLEFLLRLAVLIAIASAGAVAGFAADRTQRLGAARRRPNLVASGLAETGAMAAEAVLVLGVVLGRVELGLFLDFRFGAGLQRLECLGMRGRRPGFAVNVVAFRAGLDADVARRSHGRCRHRCDKGQGTQNTQQESHHFLFPGFEHEKLVDVSRARRPQQPQSTSTEMPVWAVAFSPFSSSTRRMTTYRP